MKTVKFQDLLQAQMADSEFKIGFEQSCVKLEVAVALMQAREKAGLTQRGRQKRLRFHNLQLPELSEEITQVSKC